MSRGRRANVVYLAPDPRSDDPGQEWLHDTVLQQTSWQWRYSGTQVLASLLHPDDRRPQASGSPQRSDHLVVEAAHAGLGR